MHGSVRFSTSGVAAARQEEALILRIGVCNDGLCHAAKGGLRSALMGGYMVARAFKKARWH